MEPKLARGGQSLLGLLLCALLWRPGLTVYDSDPFKGESPSGLAEDLAYLRPKSRSSDVASTVCELPARSERYSGVCRDNNDDLQAEMPFCGSVITYRPCVPAHQPLWPDWDLSVKDEQISSLFKNIVETRLAKELNESTEVYVKVRFMSNPSCINALKNVLCWYNFPKCDDANASLPLCRSSCNAYYKACNYESNDTDGLFDECRDDHVGSKGLFNTQTLTSDMTLADDTAVCASTEAIVDEMIELKADTPSWWLSSQGLTVIILSGLVLFSLAFYLLVPAGLRNYARWFLRSIWMKPIYMWRNLPMVRGTTLLMCFALFFLVMVIWGAARRFSAGGGFDRFQGSGVDWGSSNVLGDAKAAVYSAASSVYSGTRSIQSSIASIIGYNSTYFTANYTANYSGEFVPDAAAYELSTAQGLTFSQRRQLLGSCSCTGAATSTALGIPVIMLLLLTLLEFLVHLLPQQRI